MLVEYTQWSGEELAIVGLLCFVVWEAVKKHPCDGSDDGEDFSLVVRDPLVNESGFLERMAK